MSASLSLMEQYLPALPLLPAREHQARLLPVERAQPRFQLETIQEMLASMETQTVSGHRYTMQKVIAFLRKQIGSEDFTTSPRNKKIVSQLVDQLTREAQRLVPDVRLFSDRADTLVVFLTALG